MTTKQNLLLTEPLTTIIHQVYEYLMQHALNYLYSVVSIFYTYHIPVYKVAFVIFYKILP